MSDTKKVLRTLLQDHVGQSNAVTQAQLAEATDLNPSTLRSELRRLREERNIPIANLRDGYFVVSDKTELQEYIGHINEEIQSKKNTIEHTLEAWQEFDQDNIDVDPEPEVVENTYECRKCDREMARDRTRWPKQGAYENKPLCLFCYGNLLGQRG